MINAIITIVIHETVDSVGVSAEAIHPLITLQRRYISVTMDIRKETLFSVSLLCYVVE